MDSPSEMPSEGRLRTIDIDSRTELPAADAVEYALPIDALCHEGEVQETAVDWLALGSAAPIEAGTIGRDMLSPF